MGTFQDFLNRKDENMWAALQGAWQGAKQGWQGQQAQQQAQPQQQWNWQQQTQQSPQQALNSLMGHMWRTVLKIKDDNFPYESWNKFHKDSLAYLNQQANSQQQQGIPAQR